MLAYFKAWGAHPVLAAPAPCPVVEAVDALPEQSRSEVAVWLALLWDAFLQQFGGLDGWLALDEAERGAYVDGLKGSAARIGGAGPRGHLALAPALMARYASGFVGKPDAAAKAAADKAVALIELGRTLRGSARVAN
jgi:hypothetical protein